jgi:NADH-quinone oxidoreductase subunit J
VQVALFALFAIVAVIGALVVLLHRNPVIGALFLVTNLICVAGLYLLLDAQFLAAIQVIVYAGAIMVLIVFVIMLLNLRREATGISGGGVQKFLAALGGAGFILLIARAVVPLTGAARAVSASYGSVEHVGKGLFRDYFYPFELISLILLVAMAGAVALAKKKL